MSTTTIGTYKDITLHIDGQIGTITLNRPHTLNTFGGDLIIETISALEWLDKNPDTVFTVLTGAGRFFSAGADVHSVNEILSKSSLGKNEALDITKATSQQVEKTKDKTAYLSHFSTHVELMRSIIDHHKVFVVALNGPAVGGGAAWFPAIADIVLASSNCYLQVPFSALGLVPELGSAPIFSQCMGIHRTNEFLMFGRRLDAPELEGCGLINRIFPVLNFQSHVSQYLLEILATSDGQSLIEAKRLMNQPLRAGRLAAVVESVDALANRFVSGAPRDRFLMKKRELEHKSKSRMSKI